MAECVFVGWLEFEPGDRDRWMVHAGDLVAATLKEPGCRRYVVVPDPDNDNRIIFHEVYVDEAAHKAHSASAHMARSKELTASCRWTAISLDKFEATRVSRSDLSPRDLAAELWSDFAKSNAGKDAR